MVSQDKVKEILLKEGLVTQDQLVKADAEIKKTALSLPRVLEKLGLISEEDVARAVAYYLKDVAYVNLKDYVIPEEIIKLVPEEMARRHKMIPLFRILDTLTVAMANPQDVVAIDEVRATSGCQDIKPVLASESAIQKAIDAHYGLIGTVEEAVNFVERDASLRPKLGVERSLKDLAEETPIIKIVNLFFAQAVKERASDIHIEPTEDALIIRNRIDGILHEAHNLPKHMQNAVVSRIKVLAEMDIAEKRRPQDGRIQMKTQGRDLDVRVSSFPTVHGENVVMRLLDKNSVLLGLSELGFRGKELKEFEQLATNPNGIILVTGPTGAGKTTTLYAVLTAINTPEKNIMTLEDPVEYHLPLIRQSQINPKAGLTFDSELPYVLRQDPDVIMVGEIRNRETADIAIQASLTGHLVFSTLHTNDSASTINRLIEMEVDPFLLATSIIGIMAQRLVRKICPDCRETYVPAQEILEKLGWPAGTKAYRGKGCTSCRGTGYLGRIGIFELMVIDDVLRRLVTARTPSEALFQKAQEQGMRSLHDDALSKVKDGITTIEEALRVTK